MFESIFDTAVGDANLTALNLLASMGVALALGVLVSGVYMKTHTARMPSQNFALTLVVLPAIVTVIILLVGNSVARAFSLAGAFSIIRFRSAPGDPKDITYVLFSMAVGLTCGMGYLFYGVIVAVVLCIAMVILEAAKFGKAKAAQKLLKITVPENLDYQDAFDGILKKYTASYKMLKVRTTDLGSLYELQYSITSRDGTDEKEFIDALRCRNGNLSITLVLDAPQSDF